LKVSLRSPIDVDEFLRIPIHQWEPTALNLHHDSVALEKRVIHVWQDKFNFRGLV
jgi:hypothetical protein